MSKICKILVVIIFASLFSAFSQFAFAETTSGQSSDEIEAALEEEIDDGLSNIDFSAVDEVAKPFFQNFAEKVREIINGEFDTTESFWIALCEMFGSNITSVLPQLVGIFCVLVVCGLVRNTSEGFISADTGNVISFVGVTVISVSVLSLAVGAFREVSEMISQTSALSDAVMPVMLTLVIANGGAASSSVCQPAMVMFSSVIVDVVKNVILPLSVFGMAFVVVNNISSNMRVEKMTSFLNGASAWLLGILFTLFSAFTAVQGITAASVDGVSFRAAKFAAKNYIPILGGYISDGFDIVVASTSLIKNAFGAVSMLVMFFILAKPLAILVYANLGLQAVAAVCEPIVDGKYIKLLSGICKTLTFLTALVFAVAFMFCILVFIAMNCANMV